MKTYARYQEFKGKLEPTGGDILGPFYLPGAPMLPDHRLVPDPTLVLTGYVRNTDGEPVSGAILDFWQADEQGVYDEHGMKLRGKLTTTTAGNYTLGTVKPGFYKISEPGQPDDFRCSHIHVKVWVNGKEKLTTQLYFSDDPFDDTDHWFSADRCIRFLEGSPMHARFDFVLQQE